MSARHYPDICDNAPVGRKLWYGYEVATVLREHRTQRRTGRLAALLPVSLQQRLRVLHRHVVCHVLSLWFNRQLYGRARSENHHELCFARAVIDCVDRRLIRRAGRCSHLAQLNGAARQRR